MALLHGRHALSVAEVWDLASIQHACTLGLLHAGCLYRVVGIDRDLLLVRSGLLRLETKGVLADRVVKVRVLFLIVGFLLGLTDEDGGMRLVLRLGWRVLWLRASWQGVHALVKVLGPEGVLVDLGLSIGRVLILLLHCVVVVVDQATRPRYGPVDAVHRILESLHLLVVGLDDGVHVALARAWVQGTASRHRVIFETPLNAVVWYVSRICRTRRGLGWRLGSRRLRRLTDCVANEGVPVSGAASCLVQSLLHLLLAIFVFIEVIDRCRWTSRFLTRLDLRHRNRCRRRRLISSLRYCLSCRGCPADISHH